MQMQIGLHRNAIGGGSCRSDRWRTGSRGKSAVLRRQRGRLNPMPVTRQCSDQHQPAPSIGRCIGPLHREHLWAVLSVQP
jgi:hypothetical protein